jgi:hypothetical protein
VLPCARVCTAMAFRDGEEEGRRRKKEEGCLIEEGSEAF